MRFFTLLLVFFLNTSLFSVFSQDQLTVEENLNTNNSLSAIVEKESLSIEFEENKITMDYRLLVKVLNSQGEKALDTYVHYNDNIKIKKIEALIYNANGDLIRKVKEKDFNDISAVGGATLFSDSRIKCLDYSSNTYPYTVDFTYQTQHKNTAFLPQFLFIKNYNTKVNYAELYISYEEGETPVNYKMKNDIDNIVKFKQYPNAMMFTATDLEPIKHEVLSPSIMNLSPIVLLAPKKFKFYDYVGSADNWKDLGSWMNDEILLNKRNLDDTTIDKIKMITADADSPLEKAKLVYEYVQNNTRYVSVQVGVGGIQPISAEEVDRMKYGDCKGLTNYTKALLEVVDIPSYYTHVESGSYKVDFEDDFSSLNQGDHVILNIPINNEDYWVDCTNSTSPFGFLGSFTDDRKVLVMTPNGGELKKTKSYYNQENSTHFISNVILKEDNSFSVNHTITSKGIHYQERLPYAFMPLYELVEKDKQRWRELSNLNVISHKVTNNKDSVFLYEEVELEGKKLGEKLGNRIIFSPNINSKNNYIPPRVKQRENPFQILRGYELIDTVKVNIPQGYQIEALSENKEFKSIFGDYKLEIIRKEDFILFYRKLLIKEGLYSKNSYSEYREFRKKVALAENSKISIVK